MKILKNMKISVKLILTFTTLILLFAVGMAISMLGLKSMADDTEELYGRELQIMQVCKEMQVNIQSIAKNLSRSCTAAINVEELDEAESASALDSKIAATKDALSELKTNMDILSSYKIEDQDTLTILSGSYPTLKTVAEKILTCYDTGRVSDGVRMAAEQLDATAVVIGTAIDTLSQSAQLRAEAKYDNTMKLFNRTTMEFYILCAVLLTVSIALCVTLTRSITKPLHIMEITAKRLSEGDLNQQIAYESGSELGSLAASLRETVAAMNTYIDETRLCMESIGSGKLNCRTSLEFKGDFAPIKQSMDDISANLTKTMNQINESTEQVTSGAGQIAASAQALSQATLEQASSVEELSATINDVSNRVRENADNAMESSRLTESVGEEVADSSARVQELSKLMTEMKEMSGRITGIIGDIEDIAFQTNILSLNAAVEAARAGEAGRGFSVVANEIRRLSTKTTEASKSTGELIKKAVELMTRGADMADDTSGRLQKVAAVSKDAAKRASAISVASNDQASAVVQLRESIGQISSVVQENSATAEESAASSEELSGQMRMLKALVESFEFDKADADKGGK